ncbi:BLUF domain-containing protein [Flavimarina sp. Hel_I_48]|uniref:BLUF domain-containing protein n=1 Tax=Flavimarina sp. Hel_I_48 TaxID=1392488 RepID=UPI0004DEF05C|nr:BLUF domain-containing protein [Flavimarina sp. Hel_I_48]
MNTIPSLHTICYKSRSISTLTEESIDDLLASTLKANSKRGINGVLLHSFGNFFQVLEGEKEQINLLYDRIKQDPRHYDVFEVFNKPSSKPVFTEYSSTFLTPTTNIDLEHIRKYLKKHSLSTTNDKIERLLGPFMFFD